MCSHRKRCIDADEIQDRHGPEPVGRVFDLFRRVLIGRQAQVGTFFSCHLQGRLITINSNDLRSAQDTEELYSEMPESANTDDDRGRIRRETRQALFHRVIGGEARVRQGGGIRGFQAVQPHHTIYRHYHIFGHATIAPQPTGACRIWRESDASDTRTSSG